MSTSVHPTPVACASTCDVAGYDCDSESVASGCTCSGAQGYVVNDATGRCEFGGSCPANFDTFLHGGSCHACTREICEGSNLPIVNDRHGAPYDPALPYGI